MAKTIIKNFESGLRLIVAEMKGIYSASAGIMVRSGSRYEEEHNNGFSHFLEHLSFKGTQKRTALDISQEIDVTGGSINAYTSKDTTCYHTKTDSDSVEKCFDLLSDMFFDSKLAQAELDMERKVILEEIDSDEDAPEEVCQDLLSEALFGRKGLGRKVLGTKENIENATRKQLLDFKSLYYTPKNIVISVAGNVKGEQVIQYVEKYFEKKLKTVKGEVTTASKPSFKSDFLYKIKETEQCHLSYAFPSFGINDKKFSPSVVASAILGDGMSSRLFQTIREKHGLAYSVFSFLSTYADCGYFEVYVGTNPQKVSSADKLLKEQLDLIKEKGVTEEEFERGRKQLAGALKLSQESTMAVMRNNGSSLLRADKYVDIKKRLKQIENMRIEDVNMAIKKILSHSPACSYVGKQKGLDALTK